MKILITGATGGIGHALAQQLHNEGHDLLLQGRNEELLVKLKNELCQKNSKVETCKAELSSKSNRETLVSVAKNFGVNVLINNAGANQFATFLNTDIAHIIQTNVTNTLELTQALIPMLLENPTSTILNIGSTFGSIGYPGYVAYCASKFAMKGFTESLQREYSNTSLKIVYFSPRATDTKMNSSPAMQLNKLLKVSSDSPEHVAAKIVATLTNARSRVQLGVLENIQSKLNACLPSVVDHAIAKQLPIIQSFLKIG